MQSTIELIRDAVIYKRIKYPLSDLNEALSYLSSQGFGGPSGTGFGLADIHRALVAAVANGKAIEVHDMFWFPDIPVSDKNYLRGLLSSLRQKLAQ